MNNIKSDIIEKQFHVMKNFSLKQESNYLMDSSESKFWLDEPKLNSILMH